MAHVMVEPEIEDIYAAGGSTPSGEGTEPEHSDSSREVHQHARLREQRGTEALRYVKRLHQNMGHLNPAVLPSSTSTGRRPRQHPTVCIGVSVRTLHGQTTSTRSTQGVSEAGHQV
eukprot:5210836-Pyramimonas_sp.AAC.1